MVYLYRFEQFAIFRRFVDQQSSDAMNIHHFEKSENRMQMDKFENI